MKTYNQHETIRKSPRESGWYNTDKGELFWWSEDLIWSCRDNKKSEECPRFWYEEIIIPINLLSDKIKLVPSKEAEFYFSLKDEFISAEVKPKIITTRDWSSKHKQFIIVNGNEESVKFSEWLNGIQPDYDKPESYQHGFHDAIEVMKDKLK